MVSKERMRLPRLVTSSRPRRRNAVSSTSAAGVPAAKTLGARRCGRSQLELDLPDHDRTVAPTLCSFELRRTAERTWRPTGHICRNAPRVPFQYDPQIAVSAPVRRRYLLGRLFARRRLHAIARSRPHLERSVRFDRPLRYSDKPILVLSPSGKDLYVAFNAGYALYVAISHDGARSGNGRSKRRPHIFGTTPTAVRWRPTAPSGLQSMGKQAESNRRWLREFVTSSDRGATWKILSFAVSREGAPCRGHDCYPDFFTAQDAIAVDRSGAYVFVFAKMRREQGPNALYESRSRDGARWSPPSRRSIQWGITPARNRGRRPAEAIFVSSGKTIATVRAPGTPGS